MFAQPLNVGRPVGEVLLIPTAHKDDWLRFFLVVWEDSISAIRPAKGEPEDSPMVKGFSYSFNISRDRQKEVVKATGVV